MQKVCQLHRLENRVGKTSHWYSKCERRRTRERALSLSMFIPKHMPHLCGTETGVHGRVPQHHLLQRHLQGSKGRQSPGASCARRARACAQERGTEHRGNGRRQSRSTRGGARRCRSGDHHLSPRRLLRAVHNQRAPGSPACRIVASCPAASGDND